jgi:predicted Zn-dependent protease
MKRWIPLGLILVAGIAAIVLVERQKVATQAGPQAILSATADAEWELTRIPASVDALPDEDEIRIGDALARSYESAWSGQAESEQSKQTEAYVRQVGATVAAHAHRRLPYQFHYNPQASFVNAFALPGGDVFIGEGLLRLLKSEDALAAVLGHEVEHIDLRHCAERVQTEGHLRDLGTLGDLLSLPVGVFTAGYGKRQELDADRYGTALAVEAGYSPLGIVHLMDDFEKLERQGQSTADSPVDEAAQVSLETLAGYFRSHPPSAERKQQIERLMRSEHWATPGLRPLRASQSQSPITGRPVPP